MNESLVVSIATKCAEYAGLSFVPRFYRWTNRRGRAHDNFGRRFSLPRWIYDSARDVNTLSIAYIAHEISHFSDDGIVYHGTRQREMETKILSKWFIVPVYEKGVYPTKFVDAFTNETLCDGHGWPTYDYRYGTNR